MPERIVVGSYNALSFRSGVDAAVEALGDLAPDLLLVQECGPRRRVRRFAAALGLAVASSHRPFNRVRNAVLYPASWRLLQMDVRDLRREGRTLRRGLVAAHLRYAPGERLVAVAAHLGLSARERRLHARELTDLLAAVDGALVLGVDLNEEPEGEAARWVAGRLYDAWPAGGEGSGVTFPARAPASRIDYLFVGPGVRVDAAWVRPAADPPPSDHLPVLAEVMLP